MRLDGRSLARRMASAVVSLAMALCMLPTVAFAVAGEAAAQAAQGDRILVTETSVSYENPEYGGSGEVEVLGEKSYYIDSSESSSGGLKLKGVKSNCSSEAEAVSFFTEELTNREASIVFSLDVPSTTDFKTYLYTLFSLATAEDGDGRHGDALTKGYSSWKAVCIPITSGSVTKLTCGYSVTYYTTAAQEQELTTAVDKLVNNLGLRSMSTSYEKVRAIHDWECSHVVYDHANLNDDSYTLKFTAYAAMVSHTAVCQGYAVLFYRLCLECGVNARVISGTSSGDNHGWNIAQLDDGKYYNIDCTWDATSSLDEPAVGYDYFLKSDADFTDHTRKDDFSTDSFNETYPMTKSSYNYPALVINLRNTTNGSTKQVASYTISQLEEMAHTTRHFYNLGKKGVFFTRKIVHISSLLRSVEQWTSGATLSIGTLSNTDPVKITYEELEKDTAFYGGIKTGSSNWEVTNTVYSGLALKCYYRDLSDDSDTSGAAATFYGRRGNCWMTSSYNDPGTRSHAAYGKSRFPANVTSLTVEYAGSALTEGWNQSGTCEWRVSNRELTIRPLGNGSEGTLGEWRLSNEVPWYNLSSSITSVHIAPGVKAKTCFAMFLRCSALTHVDLSGLDTSEVKEMGAMFYKCSSLASADLSSLDTSNAEDMSQLFFGCSSLKSVDLTGLDTSKVTTMEGLFAGCSSLAKVDLSPLDTSKVANMTDMFYHCSSLKMLCDDGGFIIPESCESKGMFEGCTALKGGNGTAYSADNTDGAYARIDSEGTPGYFTLHLAHAKGTHHDAVPATCVSEGSVEYWDCKICGDEIDSNDNKIAELSTTVNPSNHTETVTAYENETEATCIKNGSCEKVVRCKACGTELSRTKETILAGHSSLVIDPAVPATYTSEGLTQGMHCGECGEVLVAQEVVPALEKLEQTSAGLKTSKVVAKGLRDGILKVTRSFALAVSGVKEGAACTFSLVSAPKVAKKYVSVTAAGKLTVKKGLMKGSYAVKVKVSLAETESYLAKEVVGTIKVVVK